MKTKQSEQLEERFMEFGIAVIQLCTSHKTLPRSVVDQAIRSATSVGANYAEAQNAASRNDFRNKIFIAKKEAAETRYWLRIIDRLIGEGKVSDLLAEAQEILLILQKIITSLRSQTAK